VKFFPTVSRIRIGSGLNWLPDAYADADPGMQKDPEKKKIFEE
jgi:hypothetical protein